MTSKPALKRRRLALESYSELLPLNKRRRLSNGGRKTGGRKIGPNLKSCLSLLSTIPSSLSSGDHRTIVSNGISDDNNSEIDISATENCKNGSNINEFESIVTAIALSEVCYEMPFRISVQIAIMVTGIDCICSNCGDEIYDDDNSVDTNNGNHTTALKQSQNVCLPCRNKIDTYRTFEEHFCPILNQTTFETWECNAKDCNNRICIECCHECIDGKYWCVASHFVRPPQCDCNCNRDIIGCIDCFDIDFNGFICNNTQTCKETHLFCGNPNPASNASNHHSTDASIPIMSTQQLSNGTTVASSLSPPPSIPQLKHRCSTQSQQSKSEISAIDSIDNNADNATVDSADDSAHNWEQRWVQCCGIDLNFDNDDNSDNDGNFSCNNALNCGALATMAVQSSMCNVWMCRIGDASHKCIQCDDYVCDRHSVKFDSDSPKIKCQHCNDTQFAPNQLFNRSNLL